MPPRFCYWTIIAGGLPTAFRAAERDELRPTFEQIRRKHPDAQMKWFARGKLWDSPEAARDQQSFRNARATRPDAALAPRPHRDERRRADNDGRGRDWRPGGEHRDPRQRFKDAKKARNLELRKQRFERKQRPDWRREPSGVPREKPHGDPLRAQAVGRTKAAGAPNARPPRREGQRPWPKRENQASWPKRENQPPQPKRERSAQGSRRDGPWRESRPRNHSAKRPLARRPFERNQGVDEPPEPRRPPGPNREPHPDEQPPPQPPPHPNEPGTMPPGPPERGAARRKNGSNRHRRFRS